MGDTFGFLHTLQSNLSIAEGSSTFVAIESSMPSDVYRRTLHDYQKKLVDLPDVVEAIDNDFSTAQWYDLTDAGSPGRMVT